MRGRRRYRLGAVLAVAWLALLLAPPAAAQGALEAPEVTASGVYAFDPATGEVILERNADERRSIGSIAKVMTALVVVDHLEFDGEVVIASSDMVAPGFSAMGLQPGDTLIVRQLLTGLLVASGGDAAHALAREAGSRISGSDDPVAAVAAFVEAMNDKVSDLGLDDTRFANPDGDDSEDAWSTARDVAMMYAELALDPRLGELAAMPEYAFTSVGPEATAYAGLTTNQLAGQYGVLSAKTGSTEAAGGCLVLARAIPSRGGTEIVAILGADLAYDETWTPTVDARWNDAIAVMDAIDAGWRPGENLVADAATETPGADLAVAGFQAPPEPVELAEANQEASSVSAAAPLLVVTVTSGVLAFAGVVAWSRVVPRRI